MTHEKFYERERLPKKKTKDKSKKRTPFHPYQSQQNDYDIGNLLSDIGNRDIANFFESGLIQAKLKVSQSGDIYEQEADRIAKNIVNTNTSRNPKVSRVQAKPATNNLSVNSSAESKIKSLKGKGNSLNKSVKDYFEPRFGVDLGNVRVHTDNNANLLAKSINARAFTHGNDIVFGKGEYQPNLLRGKKLIAHELAHTIQQNSGVSDVVQREEGLGFFIGHLVVKGDYLNKLAEKYNTTVEAIKDLNPQINGRSQPNQINIGETLKIPTNTADSTNSRYNHSYIPSSTPEEWAEDVINVMKEVQETNSNMYITAKSGWEKIKILNLQFYDLLNILREIKKKSSDNNNYYYFLAFNYEYIDFINKDEEFKKSIKVCLYRIENSFFEDYDNMIDVDEELQTLKDKIFQVDKKDIQDFMNISGIDWVEVLSVFGLGPIYGILLNLLRENFRLENLDNRLKRLDPYSEGGYTSENEFHEEEEFLSVNKLGKAIYLFQNKAIALAEKLISENLVTAKEERSRYNSESELDELFT